MNKLLLYILLISAPTMLKAQRSYETNPDRKRANIWYFGQNAGISFNNNTVGPLFDGRVNTDESSGVICDTSGNLLFYTDGRTIWNKQHDTLEGGTDLKGHPSSSQTGLILKHPGNDSIYYIFNTPYSNDYSSGATYTVVNIRLNGGLGKVLRKNIILHGNSSEKIAATYHRNGKDIWLLGHEWGNNRFFKYLLTKDGVKPCGFQQDIGISYIFYPPFNTSYFACQGFLKFSPNGKKLAHVLTAPDILNKYNELYDFDNQSGTLHLANQFTYKNYAWGTEFSPNSRFLYVVDERSSLIAVNTETLSKDTIPGLKIRTRATLQLAVDHHIYIAESDSGSIIALKSTDIKDSIKIFKNYVNLSPRKLLHGFPNLFSSYLHTPSVDFTYTYDCTTNTIDFEARDTIGAINHYWFVKQAYGTSSASANAKRPNFEFPDTGVYNVRYIADNGTRRDTIMKQITIYPRIARNFLGNDTAYCKQNLQSVTFRTPPGMHCVRWQDGSSAESFTADTAGRYSVTITNQAFCTLSDTIYLLEADAPRKPLIVQKHDTLFATGAGTFQWFYNGNPIGQNKSFLKISQDGRYKVKLSAGACDSTSDEDRYYTSIEPISFNTIRIYPNPANNILHVSMQDSQEPVRMHIYSMTGVLLSDHILSASTTLHIESYPAGAYIITLTDLQSNTKTFKLIKQ